MRAADVIVRALEAQGLKRVYCVPGESYLALLDALHDFRSLKTWCAVMNPAPASWPWPKPRSPVSRAASWFRAARAPPMARSPSTSPSRMPYRSSSSSGRCRARNVAAAPSRRSTTPSSLAAWPRPSGRSAKPRKSPRSSSGPFTAPRREHQARWWWCCRRTCSASRSISHCRSPTRSPDRLPRPRKSMPWQACCKMPSGRSSLPAAGSAARGRRERSQGLRRETLRAGGDQLEEPGRLRQQQPPLCWTSRRRQPEDPQGRAGARRSRHRRRHTARRHRQPELEFPVGTPAQAAAHPYISGHRTDRRRVPHRSRYRRRTGRRARGPIASSSHAPDRAAEMDHGDP